jgi:hypothetical protein
VEPEPVEPEPVEPEPVEPEPSEPESAESEPVETAAADYDSAVSTRAQVLTPDGTKAGTDSASDEDQLHLQLEPDEPSEAEIPVLTNAVYVPDPAPRKPAPPGPVESPHEARIARFIDSLHVRFHLTGLDTLSPEQEKELHDTLVEFLDEPERD